MSGIDLIILGLLFEKSMNAYEIVSILESRKINYWVKISPQGVYRNVLQLNKRGFVSGKRVKDGNMPEKVIYSITKKGKEYFNKLMIYFSKNIGNSYFDFNPVIVNIDKIDKKNAAEIFSSIKRNIKERMDMIENNLSARKNGNTPIIGIAVIDQYKMIYDALLKWADKYTDLIK